MTRSRLKNANTKKNIFFNYWENTDENWENTARFWIGNDADIRRQKRPNKITDMGPYICLQRLLADDKNHH